MLPCIKGDLRWLATTAQLVTSNKYKLCIKLGLIKIAPICGSFGDEEVQNLSEIQQIEKNE